MTGDSRAGIEFVFYIVGSSKLSLDPSLRWITLRVLTLKRHLRMRGCHSQKLVKELASSPAVILGPVPRIHGAIKADGQNSKT